MEVRETWSQRVFCAKLEGLNQYNTWLENNDLNIKFCSKMMKSSDTIGEYVSPGDDVFIVLNKDFAQSTGSKFTLKHSDGTLLLLEISTNTLHIAAANTSITQDAEYQPAPMEKKMKVYVHYEIGNHDDSRSKFSLHMSSKVFFVIAASVKDSTATQVFHITDANKTVGSLIKVK